MLQKKMSGTKKYPLVLMLEPLHACNLKCSGGGRIREYSDTLKKQLTVEQCLHAVKECDAPIVSICGGEPLLHPDIVEMTDKIIRQGKHIYLCTNGVLLNEKLDDFVQLAKRNRQVKKRLYWNVHIDGTEKKHDAICGKPGTFRKAMLGIAGAKLEKFYVYTNTTLYKKSSVNDLIDLAEMLHHNTFKGLSKFKIDGMMIAPGYGYEAVNNKKAFFLSRTETHELFREVRQQMRQYRITATPIYMDFLCGERDLPCATWANPTYNVKGWKSPCYLMTDKHYETFAEFMEQTDWSKIGLGNDARCQDCMMHCGFEPAAVLFGNRLRDLVRMALWQLGVV
jgi:hopanoid biosynthesis associated radical SAM protein HpnH